MKRAVKSMFAKIGLARDPGGVLAHMKSIARERPLDINIETTNFCAASCVFCPNSKGKRQRRLMDMALFEKIISDFYELGGGALGVSSMQSDMFSDGLLFERLRKLEAYQDRFWVHTTTNFIGAKKLSDAELEVLLRSFSYLLVSVGGFSPDEYKEMYGVDAFDTVYQQLVRAARIVKTKKLGVRLGLCIRTKNRKAFENFTLPEPLNGVFEISEIKDEFFSWGGVIRDGDLPTGASLLLDTNTGERGDCAVPWAELSVDVDGLVVGCGCVDWYSTHVIGDVKVQSITEVWNGERAKAFREAFSRQQIPDLCKDCSLYYPVAQAFSRKRLRRYKPTDGLYYAI